MAQDLGKIDDNSASVEKARNEFLTRFATRCTPGHGQCHQQRANRALLQNVMITHGFSYYAREWWHFTLADEPWPDTYFDFPNQAPAP